MRRNRRCIDRLVESYIDQENDKRILHLIVTHAYHVESFGLLHDGTRTWPGYCGISGIALLDRKNGNKRQLIFECYSDQTSIKKSLPPPQTDEEQANQNK